MAEEKPASKKKKREKEDSFDLDKYAKWSFEKLNATEPES